MEAITDCDYDISFTPSKANVMADALSRKSYYNNLMFHQAQPLLRGELCKLTLHIVPRGSLNTLVLLLTKLLSLRNQKTLKLIR